MNGRVFSCRRAHGIDGQPYVFKARQLFGLAHSDHVLQDTLGAKHHEAKKSKLGNARKDSDRLGLGK